jgi:hypothetical protein
METPTANLTVRYARPSPRATTYGPLLEQLLSDVATDIEVVTREVGLHDEMRERLRRALDRLNCAQSVSEAARTRQRGNSRGEVCEQVTEAVRVLAENWPQDHPEGAVEWLLVGSTGCINQGGANRLANHRQPMAAACRRPLGRGA